jgi:hypothetical protein
MSGQCSWRCPVNTPYRSTRSKILVEVLSQYRLVKVLVRVPGDVSYPRPLVEFHR